MIHRSCRPNHTVKNPGDCVRQSRILSADAVQSLFQIDFWHLFIKSIRVSKQHMARKNTSTRKSASVNEITDVDDAVEIPAATESATSAAQEEDAPPSKVKAKASDDSSSNGSVGISDIRKAVAFSNSVGGLEKAIALLQIVKVAKEVQ